MNKESKIYVAGHRGLVGSALVRVLRDQGFTNIVKAPHRDVDLTVPDAVKWFFAREEPEYVFLAAARVGGIIANSTYPVEFMLDNMRIEDNVISNAKLYGVKKLLFLSSSCAYPKHAPNPIKEDYLLTGMLEPSNKWYAVVKIAGILLCDAFRQEYGCDFISAMPTNLYGVGDSYDLQNSHVIPGMIRRFHEAKTKTGECWLWGTGKPTREFLFADDLARACIVLMQEYSEAGTINISSGQPMMLEDLAYRVREMVGFWGKGGWDTTKPDGTPDRRLDISKITALGWAPQVGLEEGLKLAYQDFLCRKL
jgi:GDP-L-fucose synthase